MTKKELEKKIKFWFKFKAWNNENYYEISDHEILELIKEVCESIVPKKEPIDQSLIDSGEWLQKYAVGNNEAIDRMKDNISKLFSD